MTVGIIEPVGGHGGMDYYDYGLSLGLGESGVNVRLYTSAETSHRQYKNVITIFAFRGMWRSSFIKKTSKYIYGHISSFLDIKRNGGKIVHLHFFAFRSIDLLILSIAKFLNLKIVVTVHDVNGFDKASNTKIENRCYQLIDRVIVHNQSSLSALTEKISQRVEISVIPHGNYLPFVTKPKPKEYNPDKMTLLFFGQIKEVKGLDILLNSLALLRDDGVDINLIIAGKPWKSDLDYYTNLIDTLKLNDIVETNFKYIPDGEVSAYYSRADLVVLPYREIYQSGVLLLTMSYGKALICSDLKPFQEIIIDGDNGFTFKNNDVTDLYNVIKCIFYNRSSLSRAVENANTLIRSKFDWIKIGELTKLLYHDILED